MQLANTSPISNTDQVFTARKSIPLKIAAAFAIAFLFLGAFAILLILAIQTPATPDHKFEPGLNSSFSGMIAISVFGTFALLGALSLLRATRRVALTIDGLTIDTFLSRKHLRWTDITSISHNTRSLPGLPTLRLLEFQNSAGRNTSVITDTLLDFDLLTEQVTARVGAVAGPAAIDPDSAEARRIAKETRKTRFLAAGFLLFTLGMTAGFIAGIYEELHTRRYATEGVHTDATIQRTWMVNVTPHVEFSFHDAAGRTFSRDAMMFTGPEWDKIQTSKTLPIIYLPSDPNWNRVVAGEDEGASFGGNFLLLTAGGILMFGFFTALTGLGYDLKSEAGVTRLVRRGIVVKQWGAAR